MLHRPLLLLARVPQPHLAGDQTEPEGSQAPGAKGALWSLCAPSGDSCGSSGRWKPFLSVPTGARSRARGSKERKLLNVEETHSQLAETLIRWRSVQLWDRRWPGAATPIRMQ